MQRGKSTQIICYTPLAITSQQRRFKAFWRFRSLLGRPLQYVPMRPYDLWKLLLGRHRAHMLLAALSIVSPIPGMFAL